MLLQAVNFTGYSLIRRTLQTYIVTDELSQAKEQRLNQFGTAVLIQCSKVVKFITRSAALLHIGAAADSYGALLMCRTKCINYNLWCCMIFPRLTPSGNTPGPSLSLYIKYILGLTHVQNSI